MYPDLNLFRRAVVPIFERNEHRWFGRDINVCYAGVIRDTTVDSVVAELQEMDNTFPCNLAALKYRQPDPEKVYERASYAHRPDGFRGKWQYHVRLWNHENGVAVFAHYELNPWHSPYKHYTSTRGKDWFPQKGIEWCHKQFDIDTSADIANITKPT